MFTHALASHVPHNDLTSYLQNILKALGAHFCKGYVKVPEHPKMSLKTSFLYHNFCKAMSKWPKCYVKPQKAMSNSNSRGAQILRSSTFCKYVIHPWLWLYLIFILSTRCVRSNVIGPISLGLNWKSFNPANSQYCQINLAVLVQYRLG